VGGSDLPILCSNKTLAIYLQIH